MTRHGWLLAAGAFVLYAWCAAPGLEWLDAGELVTAAWNLGVSHPPGQPGYTMLARAATLVPIGEIAFRVNILSALCAALAVAGAFELGRALVGRDDAPTLAGAALGAVFAATAPILVEQATRAEVYAPAAALLVWAAFFVVRFVRAPEAHRRAGDALSAALLLSLADSVHPLMAAAAALPLAIAVGLAAGRRLAKLAPWALALGALGLAALLYLPARAAAPGRAMLVWGEPDSWRRFLDVVSGAAYGGNFGGGGFADRFVGHLLLVAEGSGLALVAAGTLGLVVGALTRLRGCAALLGAVVVTAAAAASQKVFHAANPDVHGYLVPAALLLAPGLAVLLAAVAKIAAGTRLPALAWLVAAIPAAALAAAGPTLHVLDAGPRRGEDALVHHDLTIGRMPPGPAVYFANSDHAIFPAWYERFVAGDRPDVAIANDALVKSSWFLRALERAVPEVFVPFIDDGGRQDRLASRLLSENLARGIPVGGESWRVEAAAAPLGLGYRYGAGVVAQAVPLRAYEGDIGARVAAHAALLRRDWEAAQAGHPPLWRELPAVTPVFIHEGWQDDLAAEQPGAEPFEAQLLRAWLDVLGGEAQGETRLAALGNDARMATARMLLAHGRGVDAEKQLRAVLAVDATHDGAALLLSALLANDGRLDEAEQLLRGLVAKRPTLARAHAQLGLVLAKKGRVEEAASAWRESLRLDSAQGDVQAWLAGAPR